MCARARVYLSDMYVCMYVYLCIGSSRYVYEHIYDGCPRGYISGSDGMLMPHGYQVTTSGGFCASDDYCDVASCQAACDRDRSQKETANVSLMCC